MPVSVWFLLIVITAAVFRTLGFRAIRVLSHPGSTPSATTDPAMTTDAQVVVDRRIRLSGLPAPDPRANVTVKVRTYTRRQGSAAESTHEKKSL